jgi:signal transduction histidine kinase
MNNLLNLILPDKDKNKDKDITNTSKYLNKNIGLNYNETIELIHDLKTSIVGIIGFLQLLENNNSEIIKIIEFTNLDEIIDDTNHDIKIKHNEIKKINDFLYENQEFIGEALENSNLFLNKIGQIGHFSEKKANIQVFIKPIVENVIKILKPQIIQNNIQVNINISNEHYIFLNNIRDMEKIIIHLIENAIKYNHYGGTININCEIIENYLNFKKELVIDIIDTGIGFSKEELRRVNSLYINNCFNLELKDKCSMGVGLLIVKKLINQLNAKMIINSQKNIGTTIKLIFPYTYTF